ncbi:MAG: prolipoprotein diacylglyceryl transferase [Acholeplasmataceae bacterium]|nr:prolipoprotein diacylglyceryl transferase [Acholeplasmataceae bacterium]
MYPYLFPEIFGNTIPLYDLMIAVGIFFFLIYVATRLEKHHGFTRKQTNRILLLIVISLLFALLSSFVFDGVFHSIKQGELTFGTISFLGGLIGGVACLVVLLKLFYREPNKNMKQIMNTVIVGVILAHAFGRIGCFLAGCCYGMPTDSFLGVIFPYGHAHEAFPDIKIFPTQLFEATFLFGLFFVLANLKKIRGYELELYLIAYGIWRILIELIRGDDRGRFLSFITTEYNVFPTPSQYLSLFMVVGGIFLLLHSKKNQSL